MAYVNTEEFQKLAVADQEILNVAKAFDFLVEEYGFRICEVYSPETPDYDYRDGRIVTYTSVFMEIRILLDPSVDIALCTFLQNDVLDSLPGFSFDNRCMNLTSTFGDESLQSYQKEAAKVRSTEGRLQLLARYMRENVGDILQGNVKRLFQLLIMESEKRAQEPQREKSGA